MTEETGSAAESLDGPPVTYLFSPTAKPEIMAKYGLGGSAMAGGRVFAGAMALDQTTLSRFEAADTIEDETRICFKSIQGTLQRGGCTLRDIAKVACYVSEKDHIPEMWRTVDDIFAPGPYPKRITLVAGLGGGCRLEFEVVAVKSHSENLG